MCKKPQDPERVVWITRAEHGQPPHHRQRRHGALQRVRMDIWHSRWPWPLEQNHRPTGPSSQYRGLGKQAPIYQRGREICVRLPLDGHTTVDVVIPNGQVLHSDVEFGALAQE